jgi:hypothetical protein
MFSRKCKEHLKDVNESGLQHMTHAIGVAVTLQALVFVLLIHAIMPCFFTDTATKAMKKIIERR